MRSKMKGLEIYFVIIIIFLMTNYSNAKGGRGGFSSRGGGFSRSGGSKSGGGFSSWFGGSKPSPARPSPSYTYSAPSPSYSAPSHTNNAPSYGWNVNRGSSGSPGYGWNTGGSVNTGSKPASTNYGWNVGNNNNAPKPSAPVGPPPAYPGYQNRPVPSNNAPPAYSPSHNNPPAYNPGYYNSPSYNSRPGNSYGTGNSVPRQNTYNTYGSNPGYHPNNYNSYGNTFGSQGLPSNTYISNNYYGNRGSGFGGSGFLTNALFYGAGMHHGYLWGRPSYDSNSYNRRRWDEEEDKKWRATTQAPYFENKVPGEDKILPASAVIGAATAFGLVSLLPLNVPENKPLMYCNNTDLMQSPIQINNEKVYQCINSTIQISCSKKLENVTEITEQTQCLNKILECDLKDGDVNGNVYCSNGTLLSKSFIFCNSTTLLNGTNINETTTILNCYEGQLPESRVAFIPTTSTTEAPITTTEKSLSFGAKVHIFFLKLIGKSDVLEKPVTTTPVPEKTTQLPANETWIPEALTIPPETTTINVTEESTTEAPFEWMEKWPILHENGTVEMILKPVSKELADLYETIKTITTFPPHWVKVPITKPSTASLLAQSNETSTVSETTSTDMSIVT